MRFSSVPPLGCGEETHPQLPTGEEWVEQTGPRGLWVGTVQAPVVDGGLSSPSVRAATRTPGLGG